MNFIIRELKSKHTSLKKYTNWDQLISFFSRFEGMRGEKKPKYSAPVIDWLFSGSHWVQKWCQNELWPCWSRVWNKLFYKSGWKPDWSRIHKRKSLCQSWLGQRIQWCYLGSPSRSMVPKERFKVQYFFPYLYFELSLLGFFSLLF